MPEAEGEKKPKICTNYRKIVQSAIFSLPHRNYTYDLNGIRTQKVVDGVTHTYYTLNGKVMRESFPYNGNTIIMDFCYDELGRPFSVAYSKNGGSSYTTYFYATNAQGDVEGLFRVTLDDTTGKYKQTWYGRYTYDAWGNVTVTNASGGNASATSLIVRNPLRYRGYYYDTETGFYYVSSRYYDPEIGRWINADEVSMLGANGDFASLNLFAYCGNNPVRRIDPDGLAWYDTLLDWANTIAGFVNPTSKITAVGAVVVAVFQGKWEDVKEDWNNGCMNPFNQSESDALEANVVGFYKGSAVVRQEVVGTCSIGGTIWANNNISEENLRHEYGHSVQEKIMDPYYLRRVAIPSATYYFADKKYGLDDFNYYSMPWERTADWLGGVRRKTGYKKGSLAWGIAENVLGLSIIPAYMICGY